MSHGLKAGDTVWTARCNDSGTTVTSYVIGHITDSGDYVLVTPGQVDREWLRRDLGAPTKSGALAVLAQSLRKRAERFRGDAQQAVRNAEHEEARAANVEALAMKAREEEAPKS